MSCQHPASGPRAQRPQRLVLRGLPRCRARGSCPTSPGSASVGLPGRARRRRPSRCQACARPALSVVLAGNRADVTGEGRAGEPRLDMRQRRRPVVAGREGGPEAGCCHRHCTEDPGVRGGNAKAGLKSRTLASMRDARCGGGSFDAVISCGLIISQQQRALAR